MFTIGGCTTQIQRTVVASTMIESKLPQTWDGHFFTTSTQESTVGKSIEKALHHAAELNRGWVGVTESSAGTRWLEQGVSGIFQHLKSRLWASSVLGMSFIVSSLWAWRKEILRKTQFVGLPLPLLYIVQDLVEERRYQRGKKSTTFLKIINESFRRKIAWVSAARR